ncbi:hypothetical protein [Geodermatophilus sp. CPCC 206100]|uniref:hypothetical protein n=1 Tax=Geodermatophilus sp. CPCC 206100 TaxID=3020054 RepID=UPI003AFFE40D
MSAVRSAPPATSQAAPPPAGPRHRGSRGRATLLALGGYVLLQGVFLVVLRAISPRFFWLDDQQAQYVPVFHWLGRHLEGGRPPLLDPELGAAGNYLADPQYGVLDPLHWAIVWAVGHVDSLTRATWLMGGGTVLLCGAGVLLLLRRLGAPAALAVGTALAVASSGFFLWFGSSWWPLLWSTAWLPWFWLALVSRSWRGVLGAGVTAYVLGAAGYPYNLVVAGVLVVAVVIEHWRHGDRDDRRPLLWRLVAAAGGLVASSASLIAAQQLSPHTQRIVPESASGNTGAQIPNLLDVVLGGVTLTPSQSGTWGGFLLLMPAAATAVFAVPALALVDWRAALRRPGVLTALVMTGVALLLTQMPTHVGPFRYPFRYLTAVQLFLPVLAVVAVSAAPLLTRRRVQLGLGLVAAQLLLALLRAPALLGWHLLAAAAGTAGVLALVLVLSRGRWHRWAATGVVLAALAGPLLGLGSATTIARIDESDRGVEATGEPARQLPVRTEWGATVPEFRDRLVAPGRALTIPVWDGHGEGDGWAAGVLPGNANLLADMRTGFGYIASGHRGWVEHWCLTYVSAVETTEECLAGLLETVPGTDVAWIDAMSSDEVLLSPSTPRQIRAHFRQEWTRASDVAGFTGYRRSEPLAPRVTYAGEGVEELTGTGAADDPAYAGRPLNTYRVSTGEDGGTLVLRIPWWPGLEATVDGRPVEVSAIEGTVTQVTLPADLDGAGLEVRYEPGGARLLVPALLIGGVVVLGAVAAEVRGRGTRRAATSGGRGPAEG